MDLEKRSPPSSPIHHSDHKHSIDQVTIPTVPAAVPDDTGSNPQHALFCRMVGLPVDFATAPYPSLWNVFTKKDRKYKGLYPRVRAAYQWHTFQYWLVACMSNALLWLQICFGAILTALGGLRDTRVSVVIMVLGALQTIYGGLVTYFKSRSQPNRARQFRIGLKHVLDAMENAEEMLRDPKYVPPPYTPSKGNAGGSTTSTSDDWLSGGRDAVVTGVEGMVLRLMVMYMDAVKDAEANYPDLWLSTKHVKEDQTSTGMMGNILDELKKSGAMKQAHPATTTQGVKPATADPTTSTQRPLGSGHTATGSSVHASVTGGHAGGTTGLNAV